MGITSEIYLSKKFISKEEWISFIKTISHYNGTFRKWKIILTNHQNQIQYFVKTRRFLPTSINHLDGFLLKKTEEIPRPKANYTVLFLPKMNQNILDLINDIEIKKKGTLTYLEINFIKLSSHRIQSTMTYYMNFKGIVKKYKTILTIPEDILSINFEENKRYFYKSAPKYLEINKILPLLSSEDTNALLSVDTFPYLQGNYYLNQNHFHFDKHSIILGSSGSGKSKLISLLISNIYKNETLRKKYKIIVIDPHASLEEDIGGIGKVIDFQNRFDSIDLFMNSREDIISSTELLLDLLKSLIADQYNSKIERILRHSIHVLLTNKSFTFRNLRRFILDLEYRNDLLKKLKDDLPVSVLDFFFSDFNDLKTKSYGEAISPIISFIDEMEMIPVFHLENVSENLKTTIQDNFLTLFSLDRTKLGNKVTKTIAGLLMQQLLTIMQEKKIDEHVIFIVDEVSAVENPILTRFLSEARKYHLSLILAGQYFQQISEELKSSIFANTINYFIFRVSKIDASILVDNFDMKIPLEDSRDRKIKLLTELQTRECIVRIESKGILLPAFKGMTQDYIGIPRLKKEKEILPNKKEESNTAKTNFHTNANIHLKDILIATSTNKKGV